MPDNEELEQEVETQDPPADPAGDTDSVENDDGAKFSKAQLKQVSSIVGNIIKNQLDERNVAARDQYDPPVTPPSDDALSKFNAELLDKIFGGDVLGAVQQATGVLNDATGKVDEMRRTATDKLILDHANEPYYKDIYKEFSETAHEAVKAGYTPEVAVDHALHKAKAGYFERLYSGTTHEGSLDVVTGGKRITSTKKNELPPRYMAAAKRDIAKGKFKNVEEWISYMSPADRARLGV